MKAAVLIAHFIVAVQVMSTMSGLDSGVQSIKGPPLENLKELKADELKRIITIQHTELSAKNERLKGVEELTRICNQLEEKRQYSETRADNYKTALRRAEARIAYLNRKLGIGPQTTFGIDVINPGISRKDFDAVTTENIQLKEALKHIVSTELGGKDIVIVSILIKCKGLFIWKPGWPAKRDSPVSEISLCSYFYSKNHRAFIWTSGLARLPRSRSMFLNFVTNNDI